MFLQRPYLRYFSGLFCIAVFLFTAIPTVHGQAAKSIREGLRTAGSAADLGDSQVDLPVIFGQLINAVLGLIGILLLGYLLYGGFLWMTAGGSTEQVKKAKDVMKNTLIGIIIIVLSYAIADFVLAQLIAVSTGEAVTSGPPT